MSRPFDDNPIETDGVAMAAERARRALFDAASRVLHYHAASLARGSKRVQEAPSLSGVTTVAQASVSKAEAQPS